MYRGLKQYFKPNMLPKTIATIVAIVLAAWFLFAFDVPPNPFSHQTAKVKIADGSGVPAIAHTLKTQGLIRSELLFRLYVRMTGQQRHMQAGTYILSPADSMQRIVYLMVQGLSVSDDVTITIPEGFNVWEVDKRLALSGLIKEGEFARTYAFKEGHFFPDTYRFDKEATLKDIAEKLESNWLAKADVQDEKVVIIASILEKEARDPQDMAIISGIIQNRLAQKRPLQIDATVGYGWCVKQFAKIKGVRDCDVTQAPIAAELLIDGPYNTYRRLGLPAGPISNPGLVALNAAAHPQKTDYLYYLSPRDGSDIIYAKTAAEHAANRKRYLGI